MPKSLKGNLEVRVKESRMISNGDMLVSGYVNMTNTLSHELGFVDKFVEKISPGAFTRAIQRAQANGDDIDFLAEHDDTLVLASTKNNTLQLTEDDKGLFMEARIINTSAGRDYYEMIQSGIITNMSFGFYAVEDNWDHGTNGIYERTINELDLFEVSAVRRPAYAASSISNRGLNVSDESIPEYVKEDKLMEERSVEMLQSALSELTQEVRELRAIMGKDKDDKKLAKKSKDEKEAGSKEAEDKAGDKEDESSLKDKQKQEDKKDEKVEKDNSEETESKKEDEKVDADKAVDSKEKEKENVKEDGTEKPVSKEKPSGQKDEEDDEDEDKKKKKKDERSFSLFRKEFEELRGGNA